MKNSTKNLSIITLIMSTLMILSSTNWFSMWMGLEINMMSFITMIKEKKNINSSESMMMYFLIQSMSSIVLIFTIIMNPLMMSTEMFMSEKTTVIMSMALFMKMGAAPMHMWFINLMNKIKWNNCFMLMTWQKLAPMFILSNLNNNKFMIMIMAMLSAMTGAIGGLNQTFIKKIMAFSSVNHMGWMIICMKFDNEMWIKYWIIYSTIIYMLVKYMEKNSMTMLNQLNLNLKNKMDKMNMIFLFLSLGGLPPFIGFLPKWIVIQSMINYNMNIELMILMFSSMITLFYYLRMVTPIIMSNNTMMKYNIFNNQKNLNLMKMIINFMLPVTMMMNMM